MASFVDIQTRVKRRVIDLPSAVTSEVPTLINEAMKRLQKRHNFKVMETETAQLTTTVATRTLSTAAVPSNLKELRGLPYLVTNTGRSIDLLNPANRKTVVRELSVNDATAKGQPRVVLDSEPSDTGVRNWEIYPFPDGLSDWTGGEYRVVIPYWRYLPVLVADADTNWFTTHAEEYLIKQATSEAFGLDWDFDNMAIFAQLASEEMRDAIKEDKLFRLAGVDTFVPRQDVHGNRLRS